MSFRDMQIVGHKLSGPSVTEVVTDKHDGEFTPDTIIIHYTAGSSVESSVRTLTDPSVEASAHLVVGREGEVVQLVPFDHIAWHAGRSRYTFPDGSSRSDFNKSSIGIETDNAGALTSSGSDRYSSWFNRNYGPEEVIRAAHRNESAPRYWHKYTPSQIESVEAICRLLAAEYPIRHILGHEEIAPDRKSDPGPAFPLDKLRERVLHGSRRGDGETPEIVDFPLSGTVVADKLNIRANASGASERVAKALERDTRVTAHAQRNGWYKVSVRIEGWVHGDYVTLDLPQGDPT